MTGGLFLGDIPQNVTEQAIIDVFKTYGEIDRVIIKVDKRTQYRLGYGFVYFKNPDPVKTILDSKNFIVCYINLVHFKI